MRQFKLSTSKVEEMGAALEESVVHADARALIRGYVAAHQALGTRYEAALQPFSASKGKAARQAAEELTAQAEALAAVVKRLAGLVHGGAARDAQPVV